MTRSQRLTDLLLRLMIAKIHLNQKGMAALNTPIATHKVNETLEMVVNEIEKTAEMEEFREKVE